MEQAGNEREDVMGDAVDASRSSHEAAETIIAAVHRAGTPWRFVPVEALAGQELVQHGRRTWPIVLPGGEVLGVVVREDGGSDQHDELLTVLLRIFASVVAAETAARDARRRALDAEQEARVDALTGLLNRRAWDDALTAESSRMRRHGTASIVIVIDIDGLKTVNDTQGHLSGDLLIRRAALAIRRAVRDEDVVARIGGDEFAVLAVEATDPDAVLTRLRKALDALEVKASAGAAVALPGASLEAAFESADHQMYEEKRHHRSLRSA